MATTFQEYNAPATYSFTFPSYQSSDVKVRVDGVLKTAGSHYNITGYTTTGGGTVVFTSGNVPSSGVVRIYRDTSVDVAKATYTAGSSVKAADLNNNNTQLLYRAQEEQVPNLIQSYDIDDAAIETSNIKDGAVTTVKIAADNITSALIADDQINSEHYVDGSIDTQHIGADQITNALIADNQIDSEHYVDGSIDRVHLAADIVDGTKIADDSINSEHYVDASIDEQHVANSAITANKIADGTVGTLELANGAVTTAKIADSNVTTAKIADLAVNNSKLGNGSVGTTKLQTDAVTNSKIADNSINADKLATAAVTTVKIQNGAVTGSKLAQNSVGNNALNTNAVATENIQGNAVTIGKIANEAIVTSSEQASHSVDNATFFTTAAAEARYFNVSSGETIKDGDTFPDNDTTIATTAAINDRIIDIVNDVGGFDIIESEQHFPNTNPQGQAGSAAVLSIKAASTNLVPSGTTVTIVNGNLANNANITITGVTSTIPSGFGFIVESTNTLHTYTFHRLVPKATEVTTVAGKATEIGRLGTAAAVEDMSILGTTDVVADMAILGTTDVVSDMNALAVTDVINDMNTLAVTDVISDMDVVATNVTNVNNVGNNVTNVNSVSNSAGANQTFTITVQNVSGNKYFVDGVQTPVLKLARGKTYTFDMSDSSNSGHPLAFRDSSDNSYTTGVTTSGTAGSSGATVVIVVAANAPSSLKYYCTSHGNAMGNTITVIDDNVGTVAGSISNVNTVAGAISNVNSVGGSISNVNTVASNISNVNSFFNTYRIGANNPTTSLDTGDLFFNTTSNSLKVYTGSAWVDGVTATGDFAVVTGNTFTGSNNHNDNVKSIYGTGSDLEIFHDGSNSFIKDTGTGILVVATNRVHINNAANNENMIRAFENGTVELYYDNSKKFETTNTGVSVTGKITGTNDLTIDTNTLHVDSSNNRVGMGTTSPVSDIHTVSSSDHVITHQSTTSGADIRMNFRDSGNTDKGGIHYLFNGNSIKFIAAESERMRINSSGIDVTGNITVSGTVDGVDIAALNTTVSNITTDVVSDTSPQLGGNLDSNGNDIVFGDGDKARFGASNDLQIRHDGNNSILSHNGGGDLLINTADGEKIYVDTSEIVFRNAGSNETLFKATQNGAVKLHYDDSKKFETTSAGATVTGDVTATGNVTATGFSTNGGGVTLNGANYNAAWVRSADTMRFYDNAVAAFGNADDLKIFHNGSGSYLRDSGTGNLELWSNTLVFRNAAGNEVMAAFLEDGTSKLYYNNVQTFETTSGGATLTGDFTVTGNVYVGNHLTIQDSDGSSDMLKIGAGEDLRIYHYNNSSYIRQHTDKPLVIGGTSTGQTLYLSPKDGEYAAIFKPNAEVELYYDNSLKLETTSGGVAVNGNATFPDGSFTGFGGDNDLQIYHIANSTNVIRGPGALTLQSDANVNIASYSGGETFAKFTKNDAAELYYDNVKKLETTSVGVQAGRYAFNGTNYVTCNTSANTMEFVSGGSDIAEFSPSGLMFRDNMQLRLGVGNDFRIYHDGDNNYIKGVNNDLIYIGTNNVNRWYFANDGHFRPEANNSYDIGSSAQRVRNIYTNDLHLSNEGSSNDVDGTWGDWTMQEGESDLFLKNNRSGKKYKFNLTEVS